jgi:hypothetical protein
MAPQCPATYRVASRDDGCGRVAKALAERTNQGPTAGNSNRPGTGL